MLQSLPVTSARAGRAGIASHLATMPTTSAHAGGPGIANHLNPNPSTSARTAGARIGNYLGSMSQACDGGRESLFCPATHGPQRREHDKNSRLSSRRIPPCPSYKNSIPTPLLGCQERRSTL